MSTNQEKSFIATMTTQMGNLHLPRLTYGKTTYIKKLDFDPFTFEANMNASSYLCVKGDAPAAQLKFYFRCIDDYYSIYLLTNGRYHRQALSNEDKDLIGAFPYDDDQTTFNLLDARGNIMTVDQLESDSATLRIQTRGGHTLHARGNTRVGDLVCTGKKGGTILNFKLNILQRNILL